MRLSTAAVLATIALLGASATSGAEPLLEFDRDVAPLLARACLECHSGAAPEGGLDLSRRESLLTGGESGPALVPGDVEASLLWRRVHDNEMPPEAPLTPDERDLVKRWIEEGAAWGTTPIDPFRITTSQRAGYDWWSLQPLRPVSMPRPISPRVQNAIDRFVLSALEEHSLDYSPPADRRTLIRRLSVDLLGLLPTPEETAAFESDIRPDAYERLVDRMLASPHYGVRWGRHWLDVARFGESQGFERDKLRDDAWPYRDWVIASLNADMPYDEFVRLQIAGDVLPERAPEDAIATGFLVAGPWDEVGQRQQSAAMKKVVRQDELEDYVSVIGQTFLGLTVHCARCHDHKFDPIRQEEYYRLTAALDGVRHGSRKIESRESQHRRAAITVELEALEREKAVLQSVARARLADGSDRPISTAPLPISHWSFGEDGADAVSAHHAEAHGNARFEKGALRLDGAGWAATAPLSQDLVEKTLEAWVRLDHLDQRGGAAISVQTLDGSAFDAIVFGEREPRRWMAGSDSFRRTQTFGGAEESEGAEEPVHIAITYAADGTIAAYRNGQPYGTAYRSDGPVRFSAGQSQILFGLRHSPAQEGRFLSGEVQSAQLYDRALTAEEIAASFAAGHDRGLHSELLSVMSPEERNARQRLDERITALRSERETLRPVSAYLVDPQPPGASHLLIRGATTSPAQEVTAGGIAAVPGIDPDFQLTAESTDAERRIQLANWITHPDNPLFARVLVNRMWHYHFGAGLVKTPSDLGFQGGSPSHPELLDWLAQEFLDSDQSLKGLHRLIVTSAAYRQSSAFNDRAAAVDAENRLLWRITPKRLDAETLRDSMLRITGALNPMMGGPGYRDFETFTRNTQFYEIKNVAGPEYDRRTIYRTWIRSARSPLLDVFDCPDPSTKTPERASTTTPLQALSLLNNPFALRMADAFAQRLQADAGNDIAAQLHRGFLLAYGRRPTAEELELLTPFVQRHGLAAWCRVMFNSNEFLYVD